MQTFPGAVLSPKSLIRCQGKEIGEIPAALTVCKSTPPRIPQICFRYLDRHSLVEVRTSIADDNNNSSDVEECWYLAEVVGFKEMERLVVRYMLDGHKECVQKAKAR